MAKTTKKIGKKTDYPYMTFEELKAKYPNTFVLLKDSEAPQVGIEVYGGKFVYKNKNKDKVIAKIGEIQQKTSLKNQKVSWEVVYTGEVKLPTNTILCL
jgi:hypothetical protein